jgi:hypothetical protein
MEREMWDLVRESSEPLLKIHHSPATLQYLQRCEKPRFQPLPQFDHQCNAKFELYPTEHLALLDWFVIR